MKIVPFLILIFVGLLIEKEEDYTQTNQEVEDFIHEKMDELDITGLAVAVIKDGEVINKSVFGYGNLDWKNKITEHSSFQVASSTKLLTSSLVLKAMHNDLLDLEEPIATYIEDSPDRWMSIKVRHLISHSSGIPETGPVETDTTLSSKAIVDILKTKPLTHIPGTKFRYGIADFVVLMHILENIYAKPFSQIIKDEIAIPMHMTDGGYDMEKNVSSPLTKGVNYLQSEIIREKVTTYYDDHGTKVGYKVTYGPNGYSGAGYFASISDFAHWAISLDKEVLFPLEFANEYIYSADKIGEIDSPFSKVGWVITKEDGILGAGHPGGPGLGDVLRFPDEKITIISLSNDGELLPGMSRAIASWYVDGLSPKKSIEKFDR